jgi:hypothetical protein
MTKSVLVPQTYLARDIPVTLARCFDEVYVLKPPDISFESEDAAEKLPDMFKTLEASSNDDDIGLDSSMLEELMHRWEIFISRQHDGGAIGEIKAGVRPRQPDMETTRKIMRQIIGGVQPESQPQSPPPASPALVLKLAHLMDQKAAESRSLAKSFDSQQEVLSAMLGPNQVDEPPADYQRSTPSLVGSMGLEVEDESLASYRLHAWACLAPFEQIKDLAPLTLSPQAAVLLLERANTFLGGKPIRSAAGVQSLLWPPVSLSMAGTSLAREALRLRLPLPEEAPEFKKALDMMLAAIGESPMSADLLKSLQEIGGAWLESGGPQRPGGRMGLMVFPGYSMAGLVNLMKGQASEPEMPGASCPLWVLW